MHENRNISKSSHVEHYRYKLNSNSKIDKLSLDGNHLSKEWATFQSHRPSLEIHIRTKLNPTGKVDFEKYIPATHKVTYSSLTYFKEHASNYRLEELVLKNYKELAPIALNFGLSPVNLPNNVLVKNIIDAQIEINKRSGKESEIEPTINQITRDRDKALAQSRFEELSKSPESTN